MKKRVFRPTQLFVLNLMLDAVILGMILLAIIPFKTYDSLITRIWNSLQVTWFFLFFATVHIACIWLCCTKVVFMKHKIRFRASGKKIEVQYADIKRFEYFYIWGFDAGSSHGIHIFLPDTVTVGTDMMENHFFRPEVHPDENLVTLVLAYHTGVDAGKILAYLKKAAPQADAKLYLGRPDFFESVWAGTEPGHGTSERETYKPLRRGVEKAGGTLHRIPSSHFWELKTI